MTACAQSPQPSSSERSEHRYESDESEALPEVPYDFDAQPEATSGTASQEERWWEGESPCPEASEMFGGPPPEHDQVGCKTEKGKNVGRATKFHENGKKREEGTFDDHFADGLWTEWNDSGQKIAETPYERGKKNGLETVWYEGGVIKSQRPYVDGKRHGVVFIWDEQERKRTAVPYEHGKKNGVEARWDIDGQLARVLIWEHGRERD